MINRHSFHGVVETTAGTNAWAENTYESAANVMKLDRVECVFYNKWWLVWAPNSFRAWCAEHLRNVICENGYIFRKTKSIKRQLAGMEATLNGHSH